MSEQSEFEIALMCKFVTTTDINAARGHEIGARWARDWILAKAKELSWEEGMNKNLSLEDLEEACK